MRAWEVAVAVVLLVLCLAIGLFIGEMLAPEPAIGVIRFDAEIDFSTANRLIEVLETARQDSRVAGVVLEILSPGGYATTSESIFYTLLKLRQAKPVVAVVDGMAASGGYYMAVAANRIYAPASSEIGNVGTRGSRPADPVLAPEELSSGPYKLSGGSRFEKIHQLDLTGRSFVDNVVSQRSKSQLNPLKLTADEIGEARLYLGSEALALGLIDGEGGRSEGIIAVAELAGLRDYKVVDLVPFLGLARPPQATPAVNSLQAMLDAAPPGAIFMLDSRIPLRAAALPPALAHLPSKRARDGVLMPSTGKSSFASSLLPALPVPASSGD